jgi:2-polyprenyl-3-methyl-5-hydroxy-6-metoxy-1,4-benzoquinol methylase
MQCNLCGSSSFSVRFRFDHCTVLRCGKCGLVCLDPFGGGTCLSDLYTEDYFQERNEYFCPKGSSASEEGLEAHTKSFLDGLTRIEKYKGDGRLLDLGCALGAFLSLAKDHGWDPCGVDVSSYAAEKARGLSGVEVHQGELADCFFPDASFDAVTLWDVVEHVPDPAETLREVHRVLKDDGVILMDTPNEGALVRRISYLMYRLLGRRVSYPANKLYHQYHLYYFSQTALRTLLEQCGFEVIEIVTKPILTEKGRGRRLERALVSLVAALEKPLGMGFELLVLARKKPLQEERLFVPSSSMVPFQLRMSKTVSCAA